MGVQRLPAQGALALTRGHPNHNQQDTASERWHRYAGLDHSGPACPTLVATWGLDRSSQ